MSDTPPVAPRRRSALHSLVTEAAANRFTHALGLGLSLVGVPLLLILAARVGGAAPITACSIYGGSLILLYGASTLCHCLEDRRAAVHWLLVDQVCIFLLIAGTYTGVVVNAVGAERVWPMLLPVWALAGAGIAFKLVCGLRHDRVSLALYILTGWAGLVVLPVLLRHLTGVAVGLIVAGGLMYTLGTVFYARVWLGRVRYSHAIWHLMVVAGSGLHYFAVRECLLSGAMG